MSASTSRVDSAFEALARTVVRGRWLVIVFWLVAGAVTPQLLPSLSSQTKGSNADFLPKGTPSSHAASLGTPFQSKNALATLAVAARSDGPLTAADDAAVTQAEHNVSAVPQVLDVRDRGLSFDGRARRALIELRPNTSFNDASSILKHMRSALIASSPPPGLQLHLAGELAQAIDHRDKQEKARSLTQQLSIIFILALLLVVFRAAVAPVITLFPAGLSLIIAGPLIGAAAKEGLQVSSLTQILLTVIVLGAGTDYGLFLIYRVREQLAQGSSPREAVVFSLARVGETIAFSAACVIFALLSVLLADFGLYRGLGPGLAIGIAVVLLAGLTLLPALLAVFGRVAFWPSKPRPGHEYRGAWGDVAARVLSRPRATLTIGVALFAALALVLFAYKPAGFGSQQAPAGSDSAKGQALLEAHFPRGVANPTNIIFRVRQSVWAHPRQMAVAQKQLAASPQITALIGPLNPNGRRFRRPRTLTRLHARYGAPQLAQPTPPAHAPPFAYAAYRATAQFISPDGLTFQVYATLTAGDPSSARALDATPQLRHDVDQVAAVIGAADHGVAGEAAAAYDVSHVSTRDLQRIVPVVLLLIAFLLALLLRSLVAPLYLVLSVGLSYLAALGLAILAFVVIGGDDGLNFVLPFFMFVFLMALGSDYNILVMTRIREEARKSDLRTAVRDAIAATGGTVTSAGLVLAGTFAILTVAGDAQAREIGLGLAAGVLLDTFLVRTLLIPATVVLIGRMNWWPSRLATESAQA